MYELNKINSVANTYLAELRDIEIQKDPARFRRNLERLGEYFAFEISKSLKYIDTETLSTLGIAQT